MKTVSITNDRNFFRLQFPNELKAEMMIILVGDKPINTGKASVLIKDMSGGGLRIISDLNLPPNSKVIFQFETRLLGYDLRLPGYIVRVEEKNSRGIYECGVKFTLDEKTIRFMIELLNNVSIILRKTTFIKDSNFITMDKFNSLKWKSGGA